MVSTFKYYWIALGSIGLMVVLSSALGAAVWISGSNVGNQQGIYGTQGTAAPSNMPGARWYSYSWVDGSDNLWLFGGEGKNDTGEGNLNDLWKFDGANWTWVSGSKTVNQSGVYGTQGIASPGNVPGARMAGVTWIDADGNLWLFGGPGYDGFGNGGYLSDLWKFDGTNWTWVSGSNRRNQIGVYGTKGVPAPDNKPGGRAYCITWIDSSGNLWLFGGYGIDKGHLYGGIGWCFLNDLWKFDGVNWTWVSGSDVGTQKGDYGTQGTADPANVPGGRMDSVSWIDTDGNLWLFGGWGDDENYDGGYLNDLWKYDGTNWTWVSGANTINPSGVYGTRRMADAGNVPGARYRAHSWIDTSGNLWLFGGSGYDSSGNLGYLNDLWKFDGAAWTWISGSNTKDSCGSYGTKGLPASGNVPGGREYAVSWIDSSGGLWLFGGYGLDGDCNLEYLNDLWKLEANTLFLDKMTCKAGKSYQTDAFSLTGWIVAMEPSQFINGDIISLWLNDLNWMIDEPLKQSGSKPKYSYKGISGVAPSLKFDLDKGTFSVSGKNMDLRGLAAPVHVILEIGDYANSCDAQDEGDDDIINGRKPMPIQFMVGEQDMICVDSVVCKEDTLTDTVKTLKVKGGIALADGYPDLRHVDCALYWGTQPYLIPAGELVAKGASKYMYVKKPTQADPLSAVVTFDLVKCSFQIVMSKTAISWQDNPTTLRIVLGGFDEEDDVEF